MDQDDWLMPKGRFEAFSDAVYAIALTLLVLDLRVPDFSGPLAEQLIGAWPSFLGYLVSFVFIGGSWFLHSNLTRLLTATDRVFVELNLLLLLFVTFVPFTTGLMATHLTGPDQRLAVVLFGVNLVVADAMMGVVSTYAVRKETLFREASGPELRGFANRRWAYTVLLGLSTIVGVLFPVIAVIFYLVISALKLVEPLRLLRRRKRRIRFTRRRDRGSRRDKNQ